MEKTENVFLRNRVRPPHPGERERERPILNLVTTLMLATEKPRIIYLSLLITVRKIIRHQSTARMYLSPEDTRK